MKIKRAYKTELDLNNKQVTKCNRHTGVSRFAYNWGLQRKLEVYWMNQLPVPYIKMPTAIDLHKELNKLKHIDFQWLYEVSKCSPQEALRNLDKAFGNFFEGRAEYPNFKSKKDSKKSFRLTGVIKVFDNKMKLPRLGLLRLKEHGYLPTDIHILSATVSEDAGRWYVSVQVEEEIELAENNGGIVGVDIDCSKLAIVSDGTEFENPRALKRFEKKKKRLEREKSRRLKGSNNRYKTVRKLQRIHARTKHIRHDSIHKATTWLARTKSVIVVEDLNVAGMMKNHKLAETISDVGMGEFRRQLEYKTQRYGSELIVANRFYPSSKMCSICGNIKEKFGLSESVYKCEICGSRIDRDYNASVNLERLAVSSTETENACLRREVAEQPAREVQCLPMIQELNTNGRVS